MKVRERDVAHAQETVRVEAARYQSGRTTLTDLLEFESVLRERRTLRELAELEILTAWVSYQLATGSL